MEKKKRYGKIEKKIIEELDYFYKHYGYVEISLRRLAEKICRDNKTDSSKYNTVRNAINRLEAYSIIETKTVPVSGNKLKHFNNHAPTKLRMVRLFNKDRSWSCKYGIKFKNEDLYLQRDCLI